MEKSLKTNRLAVISIIYCFIVITIAAIIYLWIFWFPTGSLDRTTDRILDYENFIWYGTALSALGFLIALLIIIKFRKTSERVECLSLSAIFVSGILVLLFPICRISFLIIWAGMG